MPVTNTGRTDLARAQQLVADAGNSVNERELKGLRDAAKDALPDAKQYLEDTISELESLREQAQSQNRVVEGRARGLAAEEKALRTESKVTQSFGGTQIPEQVKKVLNQMIAAGATAYDVAELSRNPSKDDHEPGKFTVAGKWTPYPQEIDGNGPMAFSYTELTPKKIADDMAKVRDQKVLVGYDSQKHTDRRTGQEQTIQVPKYETRRMAGTGNITETYDEASHREHYALGQGPDYVKHSSNFAILADGSFHALPAMRRTPDHPGLILTNPSLARGKRMLFNGHIHMHGGVVTSIGLSGRLQKLVAEGEAKLVDAVKLLEAWGFKMSPNLKVTFEGSGNVKTDPATGLLVAG